VRSGREQGHGSEAHEITGPCLEGGQRPGECSGMVEGMRGGRSSPESSRSPGSRGGAAWLELRILGPESREKREEYREEGVAICRRRRDVDLGRD
jgi:hypothetical protein